MLHKNISPVLVGLLLIAAALVWTPTTRAASILQVTTTADEFGENSQACSLREALRAAQDDQPFGGCPAGNGDDTIVLGAGTYSATHAQVQDSAASGALFIPTNVTINGTGAGTTIIDGNGDVTGEGVFSFGGDHRVTINNVTIQDGSTIHTPGGGIFNGLGMNLTLRNVILRNNYAKDGGGGIANHGTLHLLNTRVMDNSAGGVNGGGGGIFNDTHAHLTLANSTVAGNTSTGNGGGVTNLGTLSLLRTSVESNRAGAGGGGIWNNGNLILRQSTLVGNAAAFEGGAILTHNSFTAVNTTVTQNNAGTDGGALYAYADSHLYNTTVARNVADANYDGKGMGGGIATHLASVIARNSIIGSNWNKNAPGQYNADDCAGNLQVRYSLVQALNGCTLGPGGVGNTYGVDPKLGLPADNGGSTFTLALHDNSPAIDKGDLNGCQDEQGNLLISDQRGYVRKVDGDDNGNSRCDMGAFEYHSFALAITPIPVTPVPTATPSPAPTGAASPTPPPSRCNAKPVLPILQEPANNTTVSQARVKLDWNDVACATKYKLRVRQDNQKGVVVDKRTVSVSNYTTKRLVKGHTFYWRVKACNAQGCTKSPLRTFRILP